MHPWENAGLIMLVGLLLWLLPWGVSRWVKRPVRTGLSIDDLWIADDDAAAKRFFGW